MKEIILTKGKVALVDDADFGRLSIHKWYALKGDKRFYSARNVPFNGGQKRIFMHREIMGTSKGIQVDHKNGNGLDNRKDNLRNCTRSENCRNKKKYCGGSKFKGVSWDKRHKKWIVQIKYEDKNRHVGFFDNEIVAASVYNKVARERFGEFAWLNNIPL